jgi:hypothetical protein
METGKKKKAAVKRKIAAAAFAAVASIGMACQLDPVFNGSQSPQVWQDAAQARIELALKNHPEPLKLDSVKPPLSDTEGFFDSKMLKFKLSGPTGPFTEVVRVRCDQEKDGWFRGGKITCGEPGFSQANFGTRYLKPGWEKIYGQNNFN